MFVITILNIYHYVTNTNIMINFHNTNKIESEKNEEYGIKGIQIFVQFLGMSYKIIINFPLRAIIILILSGIVMTMIGYMLIKHLRLILYDKTTCEDSHGIVIHKVKIFFFNYFRKKKIL